MNKVYLVILTTVLIVSTAIYSKYIFFPTVYSKEVAQTPILLDITEDNIPIPEESEEEDLIENTWKLETGKTDVMEGRLLNRALPPKWEEKEMRFKYTYLGEYNESTQEEINSLLLDEYKWQRQLDSEGNIVLGGVMFLKDDIYQLHVHNGLSIAKRHYLFGDLLHYTYVSNEGLKNTQIQLGDLTLEVIWTKDTEVLKDNTTPPGADLIISTCFESNGDRRLISGWVVVTD